MNKVRLSVSIAIAGICGTLILPAICQAVSNEQVYSLVKQQQSIISQQQKELTSIQDKMREQNEHAMPAINLNDTSTNTAITQTQASDTTPVSIGNIGVNIINVSPSAGGIVAQASSGSTAGLFDGQRIVIGNSQNNVSIFGQIGMLGMVSHDGANSNLFFGSNTNNNSRLSIASKHVIDQENTVGTNIQFGFKLQESNTVTQANKTPASSLDYRKLEAYWKSKFGKISFGKGMMSSDNTLYTDFSGTRIASRATVADIGGGLLFERTGGTTSSLSVGQAFVGLDGLGRKVRIRYDTPNFNGFGLSLSQAEGNDRDISLKYGQSFNTFKLAGQIAYTNEQTVNAGSNQTKGDIIDGSGSVLFNNGMNLSIALAKLSESKSTNSNKDPYSWLVKPGYRFNITPVGITAVAINYGRYNYFAGNNEKGTTYGATVVQNFNNAHAGVFADYRHFKVSNASSSLKAINVFSVGVLYRF